MTRTLGLAVVLCMMVGGSAFAGRGGRHGGGRHNGGVIVRDHRGGGGGGTVVRGGGRVRVTNGRYMFPGGVVRVYRRPVIRERYRDVHVRPALIVESYDPVPGYLWVTGGWSWGGGEWVWTPGYWASANEPAPVVSGGGSVSAAISIH